MKTDREPGGVLQRLLIPALLSLTVLVPAAAGGSAEKPANSAAAGGGRGKVSVFVSILPQEYFVERIGGERVSVRAMVMPGQSPELYEPAPRQMAELSSADVYFSIGVPFEESFLPKLRELYPKLPVVSAIEGITLREIEDGHDSGTSPGGATGDGSSADQPHEGRDPHTWLSPELVKIQAANIRDGLIDVDPAGKAAYEAGYASFAADLDALHERIASVLEPVRGRQLFVYHPSFGYFADEFGLEQVPVETGGKSPSAKQLAAVIDEAKRAGVKVIFVQPQFDAKSARTVASAIGGAVVTIDALARDYLTNMEELARKIENGLKGEQ